MPTKMPRIDSESDRDLAMEDRWSREEYGDRREVLTKRLRGAEGESGLSRGRKAAARITAGRRFFPPQVSG